MMVFLGSFADEINAATEIGRSGEKQVWYHPDGSLSRSTSLLLWLDRTPRPQLFAFSIAVAFVGITALTLLALGGEYRLQYLPFITLLPAIIFATLLTGFLPGLLSVLMSAAVVGYLFPRGSNGDIPLVLFIAVSTFSVGLVSMLKLALERASAFAAITRSVVESAPNGLLLIDEARRILAANAATDRLFGYNRSELLGENLGVLVPETWLRGSKFDRCKAAALEMRSGRHFDRLGDIETARRAHGRRKDGSEFPVEIVFNPISFFGGDFFLISVIDLSEREQSAELARAARLTTTGEMVASIAHEISQPLWAVNINAKSALRWLSHEPPNIDKAQAALERIVTDGMRGKRVIASLRAMLTTGAKQRTWIDMNTLIREVMELVKGKVQRRRVSLRVELDESLPSVWGDPVQLSQVILNLIMNALDAMASIPGRRHKLQIQSEKHELGRICLTVKDSGRGIPPGNRERVFQPFITTKSQGMGMGLAICRSIVEAHGGRISALPANPHGSVFQVILPEGKSGDSS